MKVNDVLLTVARHLGNKELAAYLQGEEADEAIQALAEEIEGYYNEVEKEIASDYFPLLSEQVFDTDTGKIRFESFLRVPAAIKGIYGGAGERLDYKIFSGYMRTGTGKIRVVYSYYPADKTAEDTCEIALCVNALTLTAGILKSYFLTRSLLSESAAWSKTYYDFLRAATARAEKPRRTPSRRWA